MSPLRTFVYRMAIVVAIAEIIVLLVIGKAAPHDAHEATSPEQARVYEFYRTWMRPQGHFTGVPHRYFSCCNKTDCGRVLETRRSSKNGWLEVRVCADMEVCDPDRWYAVDPVIIEANQEDPRDSPDGAAHACVMGGTVVCYTGGGGI